MKCLAVSRLTTVLVHRSPDVLPFTAGVLFVTDDDVDEEGLDDEEGDEDEDLDEAEGEEVSSAQILVSTALRICSSPHTYHKHTDMDEN